MNTGNPDFATTVTTGQLIGTDRRINPTISRPQQLYYMEPSVKEIIEELTKLYDLVFTDKKIQLHGSLEYCKEKKTITTFKPVDVELLQKFLKII